MKSFSYSHFFIVGKAFSCYFDNDGDDEYEEEVAYTMLQNVSKFMNLNFILIGLLQIYYFYSEQSTQCSIYLKLPSQTVVMILEVRMYMIIS